MEPVHETVSLLSRPPKLIFDRIAKLEFDLAKLTKLDPDCKEVDLIGAKIESCKSLTLKQAREPEGRLFVLDKEAIIFGIYKEWFERKGIPMATLRDQFVEKMKSEEYCFQGGLGYSVSYHDSPHHWCIKEGLLDKVYPDEMTILAMSVYCEYWSISKNLAHELWGN